MFIQFRELGSLLLGKALFHLLNRRRNRHWAFDIGEAGLGGFIDRVEADPCRIVRIVGWSHHQIDTEAIPSVYLDRSPIPFLHYFRYSRPDVSRSGVSPLLFQAGFSLEYLVPKSLVGSVFKSLVINIPGVRSHGLQGPFQFLDPHFSPLLNTMDVFHRENIYGCGPPNSTVHPEVLDLAKQLPGPVLDFGCGRGVLVHHLQQAGIQATGLEVDSEMMRHLIVEENAQSIVLYNGTFPSPFRDGSFRSVICSEVLEHIPDYQAAIKDIARLATEQVIFTVPDASAIPLGFRHGVVPWHLLEGTHVNFFTQESLRRALEPYFHQIDFGRIGQSYFNDTPYYVSLAAVCSNNAIEESKRFSTARVS